MPDQTPGTITVRRPGGETILKPIVVHRPVTDPQALGINPGMMMGDPLPGQYYPDTPEGRARSQADAKTVMPMMGAAALSPFSAGLSEYPLLLRIAAGAGLDAFGGGAGMAAAGGNEAEVADTVMRYGGTGALLRTGGAAIPPALRILRGIRGGAGPAAGGASTGGATMAEREAAKIAQAEQNLRRATDEQAGERATFAEKQGNYDTTAAAQTSRAEQLAARNADANKAAAAAYEQELARFDTQETARGDVAAQGQLRREAAEKAGKDAYQAAIEDWTTRNQAITGQAEQGAERANTSAANEEYLATDAARREQGQQEKIRRLLDELGPQSITQDRSVDTGLLDASGKPIMKTEPVRHQVENSALTKIEQEGQILDALRRAGYPVPEPVTTPGGRVSGVPFARTPIAPDVTVPSPRPSHPPYIPTDLDELVPGTPPSRPIPRPTDPNVVIPRNPPLTPQQVPLEQDVVIPNLEPRSGGAGSDVSPWRKNLPNLGGPMTGWALKSIWDTFFR